MADTGSGRGRRDRAAHSGNGHGQSGGTGASGLVGSGPSIVGTGGAMRARDVARPTAEQVARAERTVVVRRRPPEVGPPVLSAGGSSDADASGRHSPDEDASGGQSSDGDSAPERS
jgi:hypothetical protein